VTYEQKIIKMNFVIINANGFQILGCEKFAETEHKNEMKIVTHEVEIEMIENVQIYVNLKQLMNAEIEKLI
jgi:hypothetical protein